MYYSQDLNFKIIIFGITDYHESSLKGWKKERPSKKLEASDTYSAVLLTMQSCVVSAGTSK